MLNVFLWCFIFPAIAVTGLYLLTALRVLPISARAYMDWTLLLFPIVYSVYVLSSEVLVQIPRAFSRGGVVTMLDESFKQAEWRESVTLAMSRSVSSEPADWNWMAQNFRTDLRRLRERNAYLTVLAGAVLFLLLQGIDLLTGTEARVTWVRSPMGWVESSSTDLSQFVVLALFLIMFYLSGSQLHQTLARYLDCAELLALDRSNRERSE